ncbi:MAG: hypothetical protein U1B77_04530 [Dehalococcoidales bacterium]|nr:hypothetical protein [Dehalococcoidales bacterium]
MDSKKLEFKIHEEGKPPRDPRWQRCEAENATCPRCKKDMVVVVSPNLLYAYCPHCEQYYLGE